MAASKSGGPLVERFSELQELAAEVEVETLALRKLVAPRSTPHAARSLMQGEGEAVKAYPRGRPSEITSLDKLNSVLAALKQVMETVLIWARARLTPRAARDNDARASLPSP